MCMPWGGGWGETAAAAATAAIDAFDEWEETKNSKELYSQIRSGTLINFLELMPTLI